MHRREGHRSARTTHERGNTMATIPKHDGRTVDAVRNSFSGSDDATNEILHVGDEVTMVVRGKISGVAHKENSFGVLRRVQSIAVDFSLPADQETSDRLAAAAKAAADAEAGQESLDADIDGA